MKARPLPKRMPVLYWIAWWLVRGFCRVYFRLEARGVEHVPRQGPVVLASNHVSYLDPPLMGCLIPRVVSFLARHTLFEVPVLGWIMREFHAVSVDRDSGAAGLRAILDQLQLGGCIIVFPEGTRSQDGKMLPAKPGVGMAVLKSTAPIVPVRVIGAAEAFGRNHWLPRPRKIVICFGAPEAFAAERSEAAQCSKPRLKVLYQEVSDRLMDRVAALSSE